MKSRLTNYSIDSRKTHWTWVILVVAGLLRTNLAMADPLQVGVFVYLTADESMNVAYITSLVEAIETEFVSVSEVQYDGVNYNVKIFLPPISDLEPCLPELEGMGECQEVVRTTPQSTDIQFDITIEVNIFEYSERTDIFIKSPDRRNTPLKHLNPKAVFRFKAITLDDKNINRLLDVLDHVVKHEIFPVLTARLERKDKETLFANCVWGRTTNEEDPFNSTVLYAKTMKASAAVANTYEFKSVVGANYNDYCRLRDYGSPLMGFHHEIRGFMFRVGDTITLQLKWHSMDNGNVLEIKENLTNTVPDALKMISQESARKLYSEKGLD